MLSLTTYDVKHFLKSIYFFTSLFLFHKVITYQFHFLAGQGSQQVVSAGHAMPVQRLAAHDELHSAGSDHQREGTARVVTQSPRHRLYVTSVETLQRYYVW